MSDNIAKGLEVLNFEPDELKFQTPCSICVSGPSQSGKSQWIVKLVKYRSTLFSGPFHEILYCVPENLSLNPNPIFEQIKSSYPMAKLIYGLPDITKLNLNFDNAPKLLIIDDLMTEFLASFQMVKLLTVEVLDRLNSSINALESSTIGPCSSIVGLGSSIIGLCSSIGV